MTIDIRELQEFQFTFGDSSPHIFRYLETLPNVDSCLPPKRRGKQTAYELKSTDIFKFVCGENNKKYFKPPTGINKVIQIIKETTKPLVIVPVLIVNKYICKTKNKSKHLCVYIINKVNNTIERVDIKRYHLSAFNIKPLYKYADSFIEELGLGGDTAPKLVTEVDVPLAFQKKHKFNGAAQAYPVFIMAYMKMMNENPSLSQTKLVTMVNKLSTTQIGNIWKTYVAFRKEHVNNPCPEGQIRNTENGRCLSMLSKSYVSFLKEKPQKPCKPGQVFSEILEKCVPPKRNIDVDILTAEMASVKYNPNKRLEHIDVKAVTSVQIMTFLMSKFPYAKFILPRYVSKSDVGRDDFKIHWKTSKSSAQLIFPKNYWDMFKEHLYDPTCRFIISAVTLSNDVDGLHANCLIYDKSTNEIERFDPLTVNISMKYQNDKMDEALKKAFAEKSPEVFAKPVKYFEPAKYCPRSRVFQSLEVTDIPGIDLRGNCAVWNWWYIHVRLANPNIKRKDIVDIASKKVEKTGGLYRFIKTFQQYMLTMAKRQK